VLVWPHGQRERISASRLGTAGALALAGPHQQTAPGNILMIGGGDELAKALHAAFAAVDNTCCVTQIAHDDAHASRLAQEHAPDVILLNLPEPGEEAVSLYQRLREHPWAHGAHTILLSGASSRELLRAGIEDGLLLRKPFQPDLLMDLVRALLPRR
jgi:DNA-binding response OmpR family regulator